MKVVCDTNVWYNLADGKYDLHKVNTLALCATYTNISELSKTKNYIDRIEVVREAIRQIFKRKANIIYHNALEHIVTIQIPSYPINWAEITPMLKFTEQIAKGYVVTPGMEQIAASFFTEFRQGLIDMTNEQNQQLKQYQADNERALSLEKENFVELNRKRIETFITAYIPDFEIDANFDWSQVELLHAILGAWIQELIATKKTIKTNDWHDLFILAYVQPGDKYWTAENKWKDLITANDLNHYLLDETSYMF
jgi:hypothetical protein